MTVNYQGITHIICDIEGTTTPVTFVKDILFGFTRQKLGEFLDKNWENNWMIEFKNDLEKNEFSDKILELMSIDSKESFLKKFQGIMWKNGYENGNIQSQIYEDVPICFKKWTDMGIKVGIYSSGSVDAQKLLFKFSNFGNQSHNLTHYFDTVNAGPKTIPDSYIKVIKELKVQDPRQILFLSDSSLEINAASKAGIQVCRIDRDSLSAINDFRQISLK